MKRELKNTTLNIRTVQAVRDMAAKLAKADQRSLAQTIERLIRAEYERSHGKVTIDWSTGEAINEDEAT
jgi:hypothetical protein